MHHVPHLAPPPLAAALSPRLMFTSPAPSGVTSDSSVGSGYGLFLLLHRLSRGFVVGPPGEDIERELPARKPTGRAQKPMTMHTAHSPPVRFMNPMRDPRRCGRHPR